MQLHLKTTAAAPVNPLTDTQRQMVAHAIMIAENAARDLCTNAGDGPNARPSVASLNRTVERLASIEATLKAVLA